MRDVVVFVYHDDILVIGWGNCCVKPAADTIVALLILDGALVSPNTILTPLICVDRIFKQFRFGEGVI